MKKVELQEFLEIIKSRTFIFERYLAMDNSLMEELSTRSLLHSSYSCNYSNTDLDKLITFSMEQLARERKDYINQYNIWPSTRFKEIDDKSAQWDPYINPSTTRPHRYQILPFYENGRWQLSIFDAAEKLVICYDTMWTAGTTVSTFLVS